MKLGNWNLQSRSRDTSSWWIFFDHQEESYRSSSFWLWSLHSRGSFIILFCFFFCCLRNLFTDVRTLLTFLCAEAPPGVVIGFYPGVIYYPPVRISFGCLRSCVFEELYAFWFNKFSKFNLFWRRNCLHLIFFQLLNNKMKCTCSQGFSLEEYFLSKSILFKVKFLKSQSFEKAIFFNLLYFF
jgi:hypothetical protein